jgi:hypothetical protein
MTPVSPAPEQKEVPMPETVQYRNKEIHSGTGILRYRTEMMNSGTPMSVELVSMPMPSYAKKAWKNDLSQPIWDRNKNFSLRVTNLLT